MKIPSCGLLTQVGQTGAKTTRFGSVVFRILPVARANGDKSQCPSHPFPLMLATIWVHLLEFCRRVGEIFRYPMEQPLIASARRDQRKSERAIDHCCERQRHLREPSETGDAQQPGKRACPECFGASATGVAIFGAMPGAVGKHSTASLSRSEAMRRKLHPRGAAVRVSTSA